MNKKKLGGWFGALVAAAAAIVATQGGGHKPAPPAPTVASVACVVKTPALVPIAGAICQMGSQSAGTNQDGYALFQGVPVGTVRLEVSADGFRPYSSAPTDYQIQGNTDLPVTLEASRPTRRLSRIHTDGRFFVNDEGTFRPVFASALSILSKSPDERAAVLEEDADLGFNGVRVFAGALGWAGQAPESARAILPTLLEEAAQRGLYVYVVAITDSGTGYDVSAHLAVIAGICGQYANCLLELANEFNHPSQSKLVNDPAWLRELARKVVPVGLPWALGADISTDEGDNYPGFGGAFSTAHLDRGRDKWNQVRRVREIAGLSESSQRPAMSGEPIGAAEQAVNGKRESDPAFYFALGALSRLFEVGTVFHSDSGLNAQLLGPNQRQCAENFIAGFRSIETDARLAYKNAGWNDSPVEKADRVVRSYSGVAGGEGWNVSVGVDGNAAIGWKNGWADRGVVGERPGVQVRRIGR